jgi:hypothetical protein
MLARRLFGGFYVGFGLKCRVITTENRQKFVILLTLKKILEKSYKTLDRVCLYVKIVLMLSNYKINILINAKKAVQRTLKVCLWLRKDCRLPFVFFRLFSFVCRPPSVIRHSWGFINGESSR